MRGCPQHSEVQKSPSSSRTLVFYDGECGLCDRFVYWLWQKTQTKEFFFSPLGGKTAKLLVSEEFRTPPYLSVVVVTPEGKQLTKSHAVFYLLERIYPKQKVVIKTVKVLLPNSIWNIGYDFVARLRRLWGDPWLCPQIPPEEKQKRWLP